MTFHEPIPKWRLLDTPQPGETVPGQWYIDRGSRPPELKFNEAGEWGITGCT